VTRTTTVDHDVGAFVTTGGVTCVIGLVK